MAIRWFFDIVFFADIMLSFFFENKSSKRNAISALEVQIAYFKKGFLLDLVITLPYDYIPALDILVKTALFFSIQQFIDLNRLVISAIKNILFTFHPFSCSCAYCDLENCLSGSIASILRTCLQCKHCACQSY